MRPSSSRVAAPWMTALCLVATLFSLNSLASAQAAAGQKRKLSQQSLLSQPPLASVASARKTKAAAPPPTTTDTWAGKGSNIDWSNASNWNNGAITSGEDILINLTSAATDVDTSSIPAIGTLTLSNAGDSATILNGVALTVGGNISNAGTITLGSVGNATELIVGTSAGGQNITLSGGGAVTMSNNAANYIFGGAGTDTLTNEETISGAGNIGNGQMTLVNTSTGIIDANGSAGMTINVNGGITNTGTMEATAGSTLLLTNTPTITNTGGTISANGSKLQVVSSTINGGAVTLTGASTLQMTNSTIQGGTLTNSATGTIEIVADGNTLGGTINNSAGGTFKIDNAAALTLEAGSYAQLGTVQLNSVGNATELIVGTSAGGQNVTLSGGAVTMSNNAGNYIFGGAGTDTLTNEETISGAGNIGNGELTLVNTGTIDANDSNNLIINVSGTVDNTGTLEAAGGTLTIEGPGTTFFTNDNQTTDTLTGGTYIANGNNIQWNAGSGGIKTLSANVVEENGGQLINTYNSLNTNVLAGLTSITSTGALTIGGVAFTDAGSFSNAGSLTILSGESFKVGTLTQISGSSLTAGTYVLDANLALTGATQNITTNAATLTLAGGTIENANSTNALAALASNTKSLTIAGTGNNISTTAASFSNTGALTIDASDSFTAAKLAQISGTTLSGGTFVLGGNLDLTTAGISVVTNTSTLTLEGGTINSNGVNALSALAANGKILTIAGTSNNVSTSAASFNNVGALTIDSSDSFTVAKLKQISGTTLAAGTYVLGGNLDLTTSGITIATNAATLTLEGGTIESNGSNALAALATNTGKLTIAGTGTQVATSAASFSNTGTLTIGSGDSFAAPALTQISGTTLSGGTFVLAGNLDLTAAANITTNSAVLVLEGGTIQTGTTNDLTNLASNTDSLTLADKATFSAAGSFTNSGALTIDSGSKFTVSKGTLTNLSGGTLTSGTYIIGGTLQLLAANGGITTNAANLTLTGAAARIADGASSALAGFNTNTGTFALAGNANLTTSTTTSFSNSGTVTVAKGSTLTVGGTGNNYNQTAGMTTVDGTLVGTSITATGGSIFGAGTLKGNTSVGNATGSAATLNVGDSGAAGLLAITGTYTQLATGTMNVSIGGLTTGTYSALSVSGNASLGGTLTAAIVNGLVLTASNIGQTFTILTTTGTLSGAFTNGTVTSGTDVFTVSYTGNSVVLTLTSVTGPVGSKSQPSPTSQAAIATAKPTTVTSKSPVLSSGLRQRVVVTSKTAKPILVAGLGQTSGHSNAIVAADSELNNLRSWEHVPAMPVTARPIAVAKIAIATSVNSLHNNVAINLATPNAWVGESHAIGTQSTLAGWMGKSTNPRVPVKILLPSLPRMMR